MRKVRAFEGPRGLLPPLGEEMGPVRWLHGQWDYVPRQGVFVVEMGSVSYGKFLQEEFTSLQDAVDRWAELALPVQPGWQAYVFDSRVSVVLAYLDEGKGSATEHPEGRWTGCRAGFEALAANGGAHPVDLAVWESMARV